MNSGVIPTIYFSHSRSSKLAYLIPNNESETVLSLKLSGRLYFCRGMLYYDYCTITSIHTTRNKILVMGSHRHVVLIILVMGSHRHVVLIMLVMGSHRNVVLIILVMGSHRNVY